MFRSILVASFVAVLAIVLMLVGCSGSSSQTGFVNTSLSDPPTCSAPSGPYSHVFVTVTDVEIHANANAGPNDPGWIDLTQHLKNGPQQVDLLAQASTGCFLAMLGSKTELQAGSYQQIRVFLASNNASISGNQCSAAPGNPAKCVVLAADSSVHALTLASEAQSGLTSGTAATWLCALWSRRLEWTSALRRDFRRVEQLAYMYQWRRGIS